MSWLLCCSMEDNHKWNVKSVVILSGVDMTLSEKMLLRDWRLGEPYAIQGWLALSSSRWVSGVFWGRNSYAVFFPDSWLPVSRTQTGLCPHCPVLAPGRIVGWLSYGPLYLVWVGHLYGTFLQNLRVLERMRFVFIELVRSHAVDTGQDKRIFEGTKPTNMI